MCIYLVLPLIPAAHFLTCVHCWLHRPSPLSPEKKKNVLPVTNAPPSEGHPIQQWTKPQIQNTSCCPFAGHSIPLAFPHPFNIFAWEMYLFIYFSACGPKGWWNSQRSAIYAGIIIWKWYSQASVLLRSSRYWIDNSEVTGSGGNRLSWMICFSSIARRVTSPARPYLRVVSRLYQPLGVCTFHTQALTGISQSE